MSKKESDNQTATADIGELLELELSDEDILDAMRNIPGYLDITTVDFRAIYHLAHTHAMDRLFNRFRADALMRSNIEPLLLETKLVEAANALAQQQLKSLPVVDALGRVVGILTETDFLRRLKTASFMELFLLLLEDAEDISHCCRETPVSEAMTAPPVTVTQDAGFREIVRAFHNHEGRSLPVVDRQGRLKGLLLRKDFLAVHHLEGIL